MTKRAKKPTFAKQMIFRTEQVVGVVGRHSAMMEHAIALSNAKGGGIYAGAAFLVLHTDVALSAVGTAKAIAGKDNKDVEALSRIENYVSAIASCGGTVLFVMASPFSAGTTTFLGVMSGAACAKDIAKLTYRETTGKELFRSRQARAFELGVDFVSLFASVTSMGINHAGKGATLSAKLWYRGFSTASKLDKFATGIEATGFGLRTFGHLLEYGDSPIPKLRARPTPTDVSRALERVDVCRPAEPPQPGPFNEPWRLRPSLGTQGPTIRSRRR